MSQRAENNYRLELYDELDDIITAMRNLAQVEMLRLKKAHSHQQSLFDCCRQAMSQFLCHYGTPVAESTAAGQGPDVLLVLGSERGFCGGFNEQVAQRFRELELNSTEQILVVGTRLADKLPHQSKITPLPAAVGIDESLAVMQTITHELSQGQFPRRIRLLFHDRDGAKLLQLLPFDGQTEPVSASLSTQVPAKVLLQDLQRHYLQQGLMLYLTLSLHTENRWRLRQMEGARDHLEELSVTLRRRLNAQRQQQIVEEIEVILSDQTFL